MVKLRYYLYIMTNPQNSMLYTGVTENLTRRVFVYKNNLVQDFATRFNLTKLVYYEVFREHSQALYRQRQLKVSSRYEKIRLIKARNPHWNDLYFWSFEKKPLLLREVFKIEPPGKIEISGD